MKRLSKEIMADLQKSNLDAKAADIMQVRAVAPEEMGDLYGDAYKRIYGSQCKRLPLVRAYEIPYFDLQGKRVEYARYKLLEEFIPHGENKTIKYLQLPGTKSKFYFPPFCDWAAIAATPSQELFVVEGEKKAASLSKLGFPAIGLGGVWSWKSREDESSEPISDFNLIDWTNRKTLIAFDADV